MLGREPMAPPIPLGDPRHTPHGLAGPHTAPELGTRLQRAPGRCGNQRELARQKNMKKQSDSVKGKRRDDGLSAAARKQRDSEIMQQKQKKANEKKEEPK
ncbi:Small EDRK-rich factor 2 [Fukomys damarensis]|uniref:Small EDRK-rich factor 2 n=1 Tax=Fukomys damarensis TaxID=885580 RepID=A0A091DR92_FUKDA|nr:Small EDRK-rich factor 2 [Fukomys damarensis]